MSEPIEKKWYVVRAISGKEKKVKEYLESEISRMGLQEQISQVLIPTEKVYQIKKREKNQQRAKLFSRLCFDRSYPYR